VSKSYTLGAGAVLVLAAALLVRAFLLNFHLEGPPAKTVTGQETDLPVSTVMAPVHVPIEPLAGFILRQVKAAGPIAEGDTELLALSKIGDLFGMELQEKVVCEPSELAKEASKLVECWNDAPAKQPARGWEHSKCLLGTSFRGLTGAVRALDDCIDRYVPISLPERPTKLRYAFHLETLTFNMTGRNLAARAKIRIDLDPPDGVFDVFKPKDDLECAAFVFADATLKPTVKTSGTALLMAASAGEVTLSPGPSCSGQSKEKSNEIIDLLDKFLLDATSGLFQKTLRNMLEEALNDPGKLNSINDQLLVLAGFAKQDFPVPLPLPVPTPISLSVEPQAFALSQPVGGIVDGIKVMTLAVGIEARPVLNLRQAPPIKEFKAFKPDPKNALRIALKPADNRFTLQPQTSLPMEEVSRIATEVGRAVMAEYLSAISYRDLDVTLYQAEDRMVIGAELSGVSWLRLNGSVFLTGRPELDPDGLTLRLRDIKFDLDTSQFLLRRAAWVLETPIEQALENRLVFPLGDPMAEAVRALRDLEVPLINAENTLLGTLRTSLKTLALDQIWISENALNASVQATGTAAVQLAPAALAIP
jgi:hypothetical protein